MNELTQFYSCICLAAINRIYYRPCCFLSYIISVVSVPSPSLSHSSSLCLHVLVFTVQGYCKLTHFALSSISPSREIDHNTYESVETPWMNVKILSRSVSFVWTLLRMCLHSLNICFSSKGTLKCYTIVLASYWISVSSPKHMCCITFVQ
jgi:hypothetical protein